MLGILFDLMLSSKALFAFLAFIPGYYYFFQYRTKSITPDNFGQLDVFIWSLTLSFCLFLIAFSISIPFLILLLNFPESDFSSLITDSIGLDNYLISGTILFEYLIVFVFILSEKKEIKKDFIEGFSKAENDLIHSGKWAILPSLFLIFFFVGSGLKSGLDIICIILRMVGIYLWYWVFIYFSVYIIYFKVIRSLLIDNFFKTKDNN